MSGALSCFDLSDRRAADLHVQGLSWPEAAHIARLETGVVGEVTEAILLSRNAGAGDATANTQLSSVLRHLNPGMNRPPMALSREQQNRLRALGALDQTAAEN